MKTLQLIIFEFFGLLSLCGQEYNVRVSTYDDWLRMEDTQPFQSEAFQSGEFAQLRASSSDDIELGGITRLVPIGDGILFLLLLSFGYCFVSFLKNGNNDEYYSIAKKERIKD